MRDVAHANDSVCSAVIPWMVSSGTSKSCICICVGGEYFFRFYDENEISWGIHELLFLFFPLSLFPPSPLPVSFTPFFLGPSHPLSLPPCADETFSPYTALPPCNLHLVCCLSITYHQWFMEMRCCILTCTHGERERERERERYITNGQRI